MSESEETEKECDSANTDESTRCLSQDGECNQGETANVAQDLLAEIESLKDKVLRAEAEMQNVRRRADKDVENAHKFGLERLVQHILPVVDSLRPRQSRTIL